jgi:hypothetical protein
MYKVRFHLGAGDYFGFWQIKGPDGVNYYDPTNFSLVMFGCTLRNYKNTARKINEGAHKTVCAWIDCELVVPYSHELPIDGAGKLCYNPKKCINWTNEAGEDKDGAQFHMLFSVHRGIYFRERIEENWVKI